MDSRKKAPFAALVATGTSTLRWLRYLVLLGLVTGTVTLGCHMRVRTSEYRGDGSISRLKFVLNPGVRVDFEKFSLASPYKAEYRLDGLPMHRSGYFVGLSADVVQADYDQHPRQLTTTPVGKLTLRLRDMSGQVFFDCHDSVDKLEWIWVAGERMGRFRKRSASRQEESFIFPDYFDSAHAPSVLEVSYEPMTGAPDVKAWIRLSAGGQK